VNGIEPVPPGQPVVRLRATGGGCPTSRIESFWRVAAAIAIPFEDGSGRPGHGVRVGAERIILGRSRPGFRASFPIVRSRFPDGARIEVMGTQS
jgi:hypothetical protein